MNEEVSAVILRRLKNSRCGIPVSERALLPRGPPTRSARPTSSDQNGPGARSAQHWSWSLVHSHAQPTDPHLSLSCPRWASPPASDPPSRSHCNASEWEAELRVGAELRAELRVGAELGAGPAGWVKPCLFWISGPVCAGHPRGEPPTRARPPPHPPLTDWMQNLRTV